MKPVALEKLLEIDLGSPVRQMRAVPVRLGDRRAVLLAHGADAEVDPYHEMFFFPTDTLKLTVVALDGEVLWSRDLGPAVVPGLWFCPVLAFDLDADGTDEVWFVNNLNAQHPLGLSGYRLERLDARTGKTTGRWPWPCRDDRQPISHLFRNFLVGGHVAGEGVLVAAQGTYEAMFLQAFSGDMAPRWDVEIAGDAPGARGSHMCPVVDLDDSGRQQLMWGERCIELDDGAERFCADRDTWSAHSDVVQPVRDVASGQWRLYTCREGSPAVSPRVCCYDAKGDRLWGHLEAGHIDMGWVARIGEGRSHVAVAIRIGHKAAGPDGRTHQGVERFSWDVRTGRPVTLQFDPYEALPVDVNGDGWHELVLRSRLFDRHDRTRAELQGHPRLLGRIADRPGEQILTCNGRGTVRLYADANAEDGEAAQARYAHPLYETNLKLTGTGYNPAVIAGL